MTRRPLPNPLKIRARQGRDRFAALTIVEMLVAMSISLLIMAAVVTVFANISTSVTKRRATIEMSSALRNVRETLARDLRGATCPAIPWQRPESNHGYLEIIEGPQNDYYPSPWLFDGDGDGQADPIGTNPDQRIDLALSSLPGSNLGGNVTNDFDGKGQTIGGGALLPENTPTDGRGLGDGDDTLMLTVRNEKEPFVGRIPQRTGTANTPSTSGFAGWESEEIESPLAEVVWFALENPVDPNRTFAFGEAGYRTIYRRALLILPDLEYRIPILGGGSTVFSAPGVVRVLNANIGRDRSDLALASLIAFQDRYDLSVRLEWDPLLPDANSSPPSDPSGRWLIRTNTLGDLTKRENRFEHHGFVPQPTNAFWTEQRGPTPRFADRFFPFAAVTAGIHSNTPALNAQFVSDPELPSTPATGFRSVNDTLGGTDTAVVAYERDSGGAGGSYAVRPYVFLPDTANYPASVRAVLDENGQVVHLTNGLAPLGGGRRGDDVMLTEALAFDLRVYDPGAPVYGYYSAGASTRPADLILQPGDPGWPAAYYADTVSSPLGDGPPVTASFPFNLQSQGAYVDLAYRLSFIDPSGLLLAQDLKYRRSVLNDQWAASASNGVRNSPFFDDGLIRNGVGASLLTRRYATYDTWSWHYENNGINEDGDDTNGTLLSDATTNGVRATDEGTNGLDDAAVYSGTVATRLGPDDYAERETRPPYDAPLRGLQVSLRAYERDSRQIREVRVKESFVPE
ncbi:PilW family protein [Botrimarina colliarenosi]|uniref:PilW family protein n=1 Tax=Botrimarina colliarenosi TaxID=2528001 RepID=UPI0011B74D3D|nr:hypothetical protein [Botrimarina colliarenosi]